MASIYKNDPHLILALVYSFSSNQPAWLHEYIFDAEKPKVEPRFVSHVFFTFEPFALIIIKIRKKKEMDHPLNVQEDEAQHALSINQPSFIITIVVFLSPDV